MTKKAVLYALVVAQLLVLWLVLPRIYADAALTPSEVTGQVWALNNHGTEVYVTRAEHLVQSTLIPGLFALILLCAILIGLTGKKGKNR